MHSFLEFDLTNSKTNSTFANPFFDQKKHCEKDFLGKVKNKAGDVEKILKEKDKHGNERAKTFISLMRSRVFLLSLIRFA
jgi:hypothetical protein